MDVCSFERCHMGKGSKQRPRVIDNDTFEKNWDRIFDKKRPSRANNEASEKSSKLPRENV